MNACGASCEPLTPSHFCPLPWRRPFDPDRPSPYPIHHQPYRAAKQLLIMIFPIYITCFRIKHLSKGNSFCLQFILYSMRI